MTREEAIEYLKRADTTVGQTIKTRTAEALEMAIEAMQTEPCEDAISRQDVLDLLQMKYFGEGLYWRISILPSVNPIAKQTSESVNKDAESESILTDDLISRRAVLDILDRHTLSRMALYEIEDLPSVQPQTEHCGKDINVTTTDAISRQEIINRCEKVINHGVRDLDGCHSIRAERLLEVVKQLPSVTSHRVGKWLLFDDESNSYCCSVCNAAYMLIEGTPKDNGYKYCPYCGAKLEEDDEQW